MTKLSGPAALVAIFIGTIFSAIIWFAQPINNFLLNNSAIADSYLPPIVVAMITILALVINPLLRWKLPSIALSVRQLAIIFAMILVACTSTSLIQSWPESLAKSNAEIAKDPVLSDIHKDMDLPDSLYLDTIEYGEETPISSQMTDELQPENEIPWSAWAGPALSWGTMLVFCLLLIIGLALIVYPQWRNNERLPFPLLTVQRSLIEAPAGGGYFPLIFRNKLFWTGAITVFIIYMFKGLHHHTGGAVPNFQLGWGLWEPFGHGMLRWLHWYVKAGHLIFIIIGITYFIPNRVAFSMWATVIGYQFYRVIGLEFFAPFHGSAAITDHRNGAIIGLAFVILFLGRHQWRAVFRAMFRPVQDDTDRRNRLAGLLFLTGCIGLLGWQLWAGNSLIYAILAVFIVFITSLVLARIVAETGLPVMGNSLGAGHIVSMLPLRWLSAKAVFLTNSVDLVIGQTSSRVSAAVTSLHGFGVDREAGPKQHARSAKGFLILIVVGLLVAGAVHLWLGYNFPTSLDGKQAIGRVYEIEQNMHTPLKAFARGSWRNEPYSRIGHTLFGLVLAVGLQIGCLLSPLWPLHPAGLIIMDTNFLIWTWPSIFIGWAIKRCIIIYGGARAYRTAMPLFLGLIIGEVFAAILWAIVPAVLIWMGGDAAEIGHITVGNIGW